ncbi:DUF1631 family protein [Ketobacter alkanivorans]|uniref:Diguanylate cyclase n=1 Tax=Ketobacter alkanivorans TaxID=1917421 RepID=A0A2K9LHG5_9GAMM|nr:DUF1631 family protein [Ketobacter alkanivorans]AUM10945.1 hypothetical protein Kalk_00150 [Ketobacter alkanivorans]
MEKREFPREGVDIDAVFNLGEGEGNLCKIVDYSQEGMFVTLSDERYLKSVRNRLSELDSLATITFRVNSRYVAIDGVVVHQQGPGLGVKFLHPNPKHIEAIAEAAEQSQNRRASEAASIPEQGQKTLVAAKKSNLVKISNSKATSFLEDRLPEFFAALDEALLTEAEIQGSDAAQHQFFDAMSAFKKQAERIKTQVVGTIVADASDVANGRWKGKGKDQPNDAQDNTLSLVEKEDFEDWLIVRVATSRTELQFREVLIELQLRLDVAFGAEGGAHVYNPFGPSAFCHSFYQSIRPLRLSNKVERLVFKMYQEKVLSDLGTLYRTLNKMLIDADVLPDVNVSKYLANQAIKNRGSGGEKPKSDAAAETTNRPADGTEQQSESDAMRASKTMPGAVAAPAGSYQELQAGLARARTAYSTATKLWQLHSNKEAGATEGGYTAEPVMSAPVVDAYNHAIQTVRSQVLQGEANLDAPGALKHYIAQASGPDSQLREQHYESADMIENLFSNIVENSRIESSLRSDLRKLEVPLLEVLLADPSLFTADFHPARQAVNYIALLADRGSVNLNANKPIIKECIDQLIQTGNSDPEVIDSVVQKLDVLVDKERKLIERNLSRVTEACSGQEKVKSANVMVEKELQKRLGHKSVPASVLALVSNGWRDLMRLCYFREGLESRAWEMTLIVIDQLLLRILPGEYDESKVLFKSEELTKLIQKGLSKVEKSAGSTEKVVSDISALLTEGVDTDTVFGTYEQPDGYIENTSERLEKLGVSDDDKSIQRWMKRAKNLKEGQWLEFGANDENSVLNQLAWISDQFERFVFVNHHGMKVQDISIEELALKLKTGDVIVLSDSSMPAVEKGLDALIQKIYDQLAFESAHDQLTGLKTRKEFERCIAQSVARSKKNDTHYVLIFVDILQFKVINNTCGYETGDNFLREIASRIKSVVYEDGVIGRIGGNEFGVLMPIESDKKGYLLASEIKSAIEERRFVSGDQSFVITAVVSMIDFDNNNNQVLELLRSVESAAEICKKSGQKEIQVVKPGDERMEERDEVMSWVARINRALDEENLKIRCQMIYPILNKDEGLPHFEVLLTVVDENGEHLPPADFIKAAEEYSRMGSVDRWVIENVLMWMMDNQHLLSEIGGFSINLSGHSLNDETFLDFIFESLVRHQVPRQKLIFEITETTAVANLEDAADFINEMRGIGCRFSLDDFGAGQSSYAYLKRLPVDFIKIDGAFVKNISEDDVDYALVKSITEMGHFLNKKIVAEFVSTEEILEVVKDIGVDYVQGYYLGRPVMIEDLEDSLEPSHQVA